MFAPHSSRRMKWLRDMRAFGSRMALAAAGIAAGVFALSTILLCYTVLTREIERNYVATHPASAFIKLDRVDAAALDGVRGLPGIADVESAATVDASAQNAAGQWLPMRIFVVQDAARWRISHVFPEAGAWPVRDSSLLLEREAFSLAGAKIGGALRIKLNDAMHDIPVAGTVHDPALAPAWQEQTVYAYATQATMASLGQSRLPDTLKIAVRDRPDDVDSIDQVAADAASWLKRHGYVVKSVRVPPPMKHPHQGQMTATIRMLLGFGLLALVLSAILSATMINGMLAQHIPQIGIMKAVGARRWQIARPYLATVLLMSLAASMIGIPSGMAAGNALASHSAHMLNFTIASRQMPVWAWAVLFASAFLIPLLAALMPILKAARITVREAIDHSGVSAHAFGTGWIDRLLAAWNASNRMLVLAVRNAFRRKRRLLLTVGLLSVAGALFIASLNLGTAWEQAVVDAAHDRRYDIEIFLKTKEPMQRIAEIAAAVPGVDRVENWPFAIAALTRKDGVAIERTYPDEGHGSLVLTALPENSRMIRLTMLAGHWLESSGQRGVVLNHGAAQFFPDAKVGDDIRITVDGRDGVFRLLGIAKEAMSPSKIYMASAAYQAFAGSQADYGRLRIALAKHDTASIADAAQAVERELKLGGVEVTGVVTETMLSTAVDGHIAILVFVLVAIACVMAAVGGLGLVSAMAMSVIERTRELGIMRAVGARKRSVRWVLTGESLGIVLQSWVAAALLSFPLSAAFGVFLGNMSFGLPLPFSVSASALLIWLGLILAGGMLAAIYPSRKALRLPVQETLRFS